MVENGGWPGETVPSAVLLAAVVGNVPCGPPVDGGDGRAAPDPGLRRRRSGVGAGLEPESGHLVLFVFTSRCAA
jgi:hypothetical protein